MDKIEIYTRPGCGFCVNAKRLLEAKRVSFVEYNVYQSPERLTEMRQRTQGYTYPQVFINDVSIGGFTELKQLM